MENKENEAVVEAAEEVVEKAAEEPMKFGDALGVAVIGGFALGGAYCGVKWVHNHVATPLWNKFKKMVSGKNYVEVNDESEEDEPDKKES